MMNVLRGSYNTGWRLSVNMSCSIIALCVYDVFYICLYYKSQSKNTGKNTNVFLFWELNCQMGPVINKNSADVELKIK